MLFCSKVVRNIILNVIYLMHCDIPKLVLIALNKQFSVVTE